MFGMARFTTLARLLCLILLLGAALTQAPRSSAAPQDGKGQHCIVRLTAITPGKATPKPYGVQCFATLAEAIAAGTNGTVRLPANIAPHELANALRSSTGGASTTASAVIGIDFSDGNWSGASYTYIGAQGGCTATVAYDMASMPFLWDDRVSSALGQNGCNNWYHYEDPSYGGALRICDTGTTCYYIGNAMNDRTSSEKFRH